MTPGARKLVDGYLVELRRSMRGASPDILMEAEDEIRAHIDDALAAADDQDEAAARAVLDALGPPDGYGRDLGLYMMVDRGYRDWSLPHMIRSTWFWAATTLSGAVVVLIFGILYALALGVAGFGAWSLAAPFAPVGAGWRAVPDAVSPGSAAGLVAGGLASLALLTLTVRWFVGQYVRHAGPYAPGGAARDGSWSRRAERRILALATIGFGVTLSTGFASGAYRFDPDLRPHLPPDYAASPLAMVSCAGMVLLVLAPVLGVLWSAGRGARLTTPNAAEGHRGRRGGRLGPN